MCENALKQGAARNESFIKIKFIWKIQMEVLKEERCQLEAVPLITARAENQVRFPACLYLFLMPWYSFEGKYR